MITQLLGWSGSLLLACGLFGIGDKKRNAFFFTMVGESLWIIKGCMLGMWDLAAICVVFLVMAVRAYRAWGVVTAEDVKNCTREPGHSGPCNGWPCAERQKQLNMQ